jgi:Peptidase propeptide and YPEB domain
MPICGALKVVLDLDTDDGGMKRTQLIAVAAGAAAMLGAGGVAFAGGSPPSRLDDGKDLAGQAAISEAQAIAAARTAASGALNEVDLEHRDGRLVYNVDVGAKDVKVDASTGEVVAVDADD